MTPLAAYLLLFIAVGVGFIFVHLVAGKLIRPSKPHSEKATIYECGEPTIGSAWIQFDLRFYVVALLFVIFDVEVAFFFPWAEVFGKANAVANAPDPTTAAEYNDLGEKILDLAYRSDSAPGYYRRWEKMRTLTDDELAAYNSLSGPEFRYLRAILQEKHEVPVAFSDDLRESIRRSDEALRATFTARAKARESASKPFLDAAKKRPEGPGNIPGLIEAERVSDEQSFETTKLSDLVAGRLALMTYVRGPVGPVPPKPLYTAARTLDPPAFAAARATADSQIAAMKEQAQGILAALTKLEPARTAMWNSLTPAAMKEIGSLTDEQAISLPKLSRDGVMALDARVVKGAKEESRTLAWLALGEILVFFGVLLVGFAYLWKRGDLAWVRATVAEQGQYPVASPPTILAVTRPLETASTGERAGS